MAFYPAHLPHTHTHKHIHTYTHLLQLNIAKLTKALGMDSDYVIVKKEFVVSVSL